MTRTDSFAIIIAAKRLDTAKTRLSRTFNADDRASLTLAMLTDTISAALPVPTVHSVTVITPDPVVAAAARALGAAALTDPTPPREPDALNHAIRTAEASITAQTPNVAVLQGDLPALRSAELAEAIAAAHPHARSIISDRHRTGTAALFARSVPLHPAFGHNSSHEHLQSGATALDGRWPGLRCDVDTPDDMAAALLLGVGPATTRVVQRIDTLMPAAVIQARPVACGGRQFVEETESL